MPHRSTRKLSITSEGQTLYLHAQRILSEVRHAQDALLQQQQLLSGSLRITSPNSFGYRHLLPLLSEFCQRYPHVQLQLLMSDDVKDMLAERLDLAIRYGFLPDSRLVGRHLLPNKRVLCAAQQYGAPMLLTELARHRCIVIGTRNEIEWRFRDSRIHVKAFILCNDGEACHRLAL